MSNEAQTYAAKVKVGDITAKFVLGRLADRADEKFSCFPSVPLLAAEAEKSERVVQRALALLRTLRLVSDRATKRADGSQGANRYYLHGPWDNYAGTGVPFPEIVTPKEKRAQLWSQRPAEGEFREGTAAAVAVSGDRAAAAALAAAAHAAAAETEAASEARREKARNARKAAEPQIRNISAAQTGVTSTSPHPMTWTSPHPMTSTSPLEPSVVIPSSNHSRPSLRPSVMEVSASEPNRTEGRPDGGEVARKEIREPGKPKHRGEAATAPAAPVASRGMALLMDCARRDSRTTLTGDLLGTLGRHVEGLLAAGWDPGLLEAQIMAPLPRPEEVRTTDAAVIAKRIRSIPAAPPPARDSTVTPTDPALSAPAVPAPRTVHQELTARTSHECPGKDGQCGRHVPAAGQLCAGCRTPCSASCARGPAEQARPDGLCRSCIQDQADAGLPRCVDGCGRAAVRKDGRCSPCHHEQRGRDHEEAQREEAKAAFAALLGQEGVPTPL
ncbi:helix-turn-helix domain-containing protein [Kitasatospora herbaricolor]|uniref:helix-turn-helix domain-containing protein n=1 Tax=Kitasatospora herbaricolor TaxID=68217 RepID=UPI0036D7F647